MLLRVVAAGTIGAALVAAPRVASADATATTIQWSAPPECPGEPALRVEIERLLGRPIDASGRPSEVRGEVTREPGAHGRYRLRLSISTGGGPRKERRIEGGSCALVTSAASVVLALAIDAGPSPEEQRPAQPAPPIEETPLEAVSPATPERAAPRSAPPGRVWEIAAVQGFDFTSLPSPTLGIGVRGALELGADRLELQLATWLARRSDLKAHSAAGVDVALHTAGLRYCRWLTRRMLDLAPCGGLEGGVLVSSGFGALATTGLGRWLAPQIGLTGTVRPTPRFAVSVEVDGLALIFRDRFTILGAGTVYQPPQATVRAALAAQVRFP